MHQDGQTGELRKVREEVPGHLEVEPDEGSEGRGGCDAQGIGQDPGELDQQLPAAAGAGGLLHLTFSPGPRSAR